MPIETTYYPEYQRESKFVASVPGTDLRGYGHTEEMAIGNLILSHRRQLGFILKHKEYNLEQNASIHGPTGPAYRAS